MSSVAEGLSSKILLLRQPLYDQARHCVAYEWLFRTPDGSPPEWAEGLFSSLLAGDLDRSISPLAAFLNMTPACLETASPLPPTPVGYSTVIDDLALRDELLPFVDLVKIDISASGRTGLFARIRKIQQPGLRLLAANIEKPEDFELCRKLGFDFFSGYQLARPELAGGGKAPGERIAALRLLAKLQDPDVSIDVLDAEIRRDASLSYRTLRTVNSSALLLSCEVHSIRDAIVLLGLRRLQNWVTLLVMGGSDSAPNELMTIAMVRARMCELLSESEATAQSAFTIGLLSVLDALLDQPMSDVLKNLPLATSLQEALSTGTGPYGVLLKTVVAYERGNPLPPSADPVRARTAYLSAVGWSIRALEALFGPGPTPGKA